MPGRHTRRHYPGKKAIMARRGRQTRRRTSSARPMRALKTNYRSQNVYRFVRETMPQTIPFAIIPSGPTGFPAMGVLNFDNLQFNQLVDAYLDFSNLFARYKVDKIVTILTPLYQGVVQTPNNPISNTALRITRVNTKWMTDGFDVAANSDEQLSELAQIQSKSVTNYSTPRSLYMTTINPGVIQKGVLDSTGTEINTRRPCPWLNIEDESNIPLAHNSIVFAERTDGGPLSTDWKYRVVHKVYFRCAQVG